MNYKKGQKVIVKDFTGERFERRVWHDEGHVVAITSDEVFDALERGDTALFPIRFSKTDVSPSKQARS